ncbi:aminoglycoside phosphotransferase family protein [Actinomadura craniellae]|uniref:Aminoglycoside phosphotransferase family protein n=1 Tax=Actinomadura craniellae TaxID=2231787 RepID=A0A365H1R4_9ACTN|nr:aminoglycoside phosphotransferase family protein [Actinomadura craniellae]RAY13044.1 aminoglycoside phosphotransferase family protein [Actinomadura craniellae]
MDTTEVDAVLDWLLNQYGTSLSDRRPIRVWGRSGVERLRLRNGATVVFKYAEGPFADEHIALGIAQEAGLPVPRRLAVVRRPGLLGMFMDDLGPALREATDDDGARLAAAVHRVTATGSLPVLDARRLAGMPRSIAACLRRIGGSTGLEAAHALDKVAADRAAGTDLPPFGLCHSEWHPTSVHHGESGVHLLDFARAFRGPGLLDLASWHGTVTAPDPQRLTELLEAYIAAGGPETARARRGSLPAARWALGWHRVWAADWFTHQLTIGWADGAEETWTAAITRHLTDAADLLNA